MSAATQPTLFQRIVMALGFGVPLDPPREFSETVDIRPLNVGRCVSECPMCGDEILECDCQWSAQA